MVQNKLHFAVSGKTAAELIAERADASKTNMGLTAWKGAIVRKTDVVIAKNYLNEKEIEGLNRIVGMYLDYAEDQAKRHRQIFMRDWRKGSALIFVTAARGACPARWSMAKHVSISTIT